MSARPTPAWFLPVLALLAALLAACNTAAPPTGSANAPAGSQPAPTVESGASPKLTLKVPESIAQPTTPAVAQNTAAAPAPTVAASAAPAGKLVYGWDTAVAPTWFDPQENPQLITPYGWQYALHDAVVKHLPGQFFAPSLAESYEIAEDQRSATFVLRPNLTFHNGDPVTSEDVKFTFENYRGANAKLLKDKTERIETPDARTIRFVFKSPFPDFLVLYGSPASGAGWVVPAKYYQEVGPDGFKQKPIGAGPYKLVRQTGGNEFEFEAFTDYWRKTPSVKTIVFRSIPEAATRLAALQSGEVDFINLVPGELVETVKADPRLQLTATQTSAVWLEFPGRENPNNPYHNPKVRQAISLAVDRAAINNTELAGLANYEGNWIPESWPGALQRPKPEEDVEKAKQLMAEAGFPDGFEGGELTPLPPYFSIGERVITQLREIGIRLRLNQMERGAFAQKLTEGPDAFSTGIILHYSASPGDAASRIRSYALCNGSSSRTCIPEIDEKMAQYDASADPQERERLITEVQEYILDNYIYVPMYRSAFISAIGPRIANPWQEIAGAIPQYGYFGLYEDLKIKE